MVRPTVRPRVSPETWAKLVRIGGELGIPSRQVVGYLVKRYQGPAAEHTFKFGDPAMLQEALKDDVPILLKGRAGIGKTRTVKLLLDQVKDRPVLIVDPLHEYNEGTQIKIEDLFSLFDNSKNNGVFVLRLNRNNPDLCRLELAGAVRILEMKLAALSRWLIIVEECSARFRGVDELISFVSESRKFCKVLGCEQSTTALDSVCKVLEIIPDGGKSLIQPVVICSRGK